METQTAKRCAPRPHVTVGTNKLVLLGGKEIGYAASWSEVEVVLGLAGWRVKPGARPLGVEAPTAFIINRNAVEPILEAEL